MKWPFFNREIIKTNDAQTRSTAGIKKYFQINDTMISAIIDIIY